MTQATTFELTDAATELAELGDFFRHMPDDNRASFEVIASSLSVDPNSFLLLELLASASSRVSDLSRFVASVQDGFVTQRVRNQTTKALQTFARSFSACPLSSALGAYEEPNLERLNTRGTGGVQPYCPDASTLRKLTKEGRAEAVKRLSELISELDSSDLPSWSKLPMRDGLVRLLNAIKHLVFFGHEATIDQLLLVQVRAKTLQSNIDVAGAGASGGSGLATIKNILVTIGFIGGLFILPDEDSSLSALPGLDVSSGCRGYSAAPRTKTIRPQLPAKLRRLTRNGSACSALC